MLFDAALRRVTAQAVAAQPKFDPGARLPGPLLGLGQEQLPSDSIFRADSFGNADVGAEAGFTSVETALFGGTEELSRELERESRRYQRILSTEGN